MSREFKKGDKVVTVTKFPFYEIPIGTKATVTNVIPGTIELSIGQVCDQTHIEHWDIFNSPLYQALR